MTWYNNSTNCEHENTIVILNNEITYFEGFERPFDLKHVLFVFEYIVIFEYKSIPEHMGQISEKKWAPFRHHPWIAFDMNLQSMQRVTRCPVF